MPHKILALKDRPQYAAALKQLIEPYGYEVIAVDNIDDVLRILHSERVDMVVLAIHLQEGNVLTSSESFDRISIHDLILCRLFV
jgi:DNA-binding NtrC family response regulator